MTIISRAYVSKPPALYHSHINLNLEKFLYLLQIYLHGVTRPHGKTLTVPLFSMIFVMCSVVRGLTLIGHNRNYWTDVLAGFLLGLVIALYLVSEA